MKASHGSSREFFLNELEIVKTIKNTKKKQKCKIKMNERVVLDVTKQ